MYQANRPAVSHEVVWDTIDELITKVVLEPWPDFVRDVKQGLEPGSGQHMCHWRGQSDCQITALLLSVKSGSEESKGWSLSHGAFFAMKKCNNTYPPREQV
jgi:hypothetical protein